VPLNPSSNRERISQPTHGALGSAWRAVQLRRACPSLRKYSCSGFIRSSACSTELCDHPPALALAYSKHCMYNDRKWPLNEAQRPHFRGVPEAFGRATLQTCKMDWEGMARRRRELVSHPNE
jgi:hypothetical protein